MHDLMSSREEILHIVKQVINDIDVTIVHGSPTGTACRIENGSPVIIWDLDFWEYIEQNIFMLDTFPYDREGDKKIINEYFFNFHGSLYYHLSKRFNADKALSNAFIKLANEYGYPLFKTIYSKAFDVSVWKAHYELEIYACKLLVLYHELAHILFSRDWKLKTELENMVLLILKGHLDIYKDSHYNSFSELNPARLSKPWYDEIINKLLSLDPAYLDLLEELAADLYAVSKTHATLFLNHSKGNDPAIVSETLLYGITTYYSHINCYATLCSFWDNMLPSLWISKRNNAEVVDASLKSFEVNTVIRAQIYPTVLFEVVHQLDAQMWETDRSDFHERLHRVLTASNTNFEWFERAYESAMNLENFEKILSSAIKIKESGLNENYSLNIVSEDALIINWASLQFYNNKGLQLKDDNKLYEAIEAFNVGLTIAEHYLGHYHRITAREYNNIVDALLRSYRQNMFNHQYLDEAKIYSDAAMDILEQINAFNSTQGATILQNAGVVAQWTGNPQKAIQLYNRAKKTKQQFPYEYPMYSIALTNTSIAAAYYDCGEKELSKKYCLRVVDFFATSEISQEDPLYRDTKALLALLDK